MPSTMPDASARSVVAATVSANQFHASVSDVLDGTWPDRICTMGASTSRASSIQPLTNATAACLLSGSASTIGTWALTALMDSPPALARATIAAGSVAGVWGVRWASAQASGCALSSLALYPP